MEMRGRNRSMHLFFATHGTYPFALTFDLSVFVRIPEDTISVLFAVVVF